MTADLLRAGAAAYPRCWRSECRIVCAYPDVCSEREPEPPATDLRDSDTRCGVCGRLTSGTCRCWWSS